MELQIPPFPCPQTYTYVILMDEHPKGVTVSEEPNDTDLLLSRTLNCPPLSTHRFLRNDVPLECDPRRFDAVVPSSAADAESSLVELFRA